MIGRPMQGKQMGPGGRGKGIGQQMSGDRNKGQRGQQMREQAQRMMKRNQAAKTTGPRKLESKQPTRPTSELGGVTAIPMKSGGKVGKCPRDGVARSGKTKGTMR